MIDALIPHGTCWHCDEVEADQNPWICQGCWVSVCRIEALEAGEHTTALYRYQGALETLLTRAKRPLEPAIYRLLLGVDFELPKGALYVPVPTPWHRRFRRRGCQTTCIAEALAKRFGGSVQHALTRGRFAKRQARLDAASRRALPEDSFRLRAPVPDAAYVVLVDDVVTTGTTLRRAAKALGREEVHRFALAKVL